jgi:hypothetical protein
MEEEECRYCMGGVSGVFAELLSGFGLALLYCGTAV